MSGETKVVCVTGASGYVASWLVKLLLQRGYAVKASVRDPNDTNKTEHLLSLDGAKERLHLFKADLLEEGSFDAVVDGCVGVFHTASPVQFSVTDPQAELVEPAVKGTLNVLQSCVKFPAVKRVVMTSSMAAVMSTGKPLTSDVVVDETYYSDPLFCEKIKQWYRLSKTLAEQAAWKFAEENGIDLVTLHPGFTIGPLLRPTLNISIKFFQNLMSVAQVADGPDTLKILQQLYPTLCLPEFGNPSDSKFQVSIEKAKGLGINFLPLEKSIRDTVESLKEKGFLNI
ncbi:phenylacetaldehyde reductase-like isoform X2 [Malus sylvestris]|uniref:phenylacetaldehyde reductase-like isoform X2 n=1 Tax=Malus sylvestris TaxID=3752 RepID=UPI0021ACEA90|nr:phenylacetaldehyde reductase-like isoform X2 [Malus sylvestris]